MPRWPSVLVVVVFGGLPNHEAIADDTVSAEAAILDDKTTPDEAVRLVRGAEKLDRRARHSYAVTANTRGLRLHKVGKCEEALPLFEAAASLDRAYGMPRYNAARCYALTGDAAASIRYLKELKGMGRTQLDRLSQAEKDEAFAKVAQEPAFKELFVGLPVVLPKGLWRSLVKPGGKWTLPLVSKLMDYEMETAPEQITIQVVDVRKVGGADVVRLRWSSARGKRVGEEVGENYIPHQIAVSEKGVFTFGEEDSDATILAALKKKPSFTEPPKLENAYDREDGRFVFAPAARPGSACFGWGATDSTCGANPCCSWLCLDASGIIGIGGIGSSPFIFGLATGIPCG